MGSFVPRLLVLTVVWLLATAALTYAAAQRMGTIHLPTTPTTTASSTASQILVVPDVRKQAYVFAKGTLSDAGFGWRVSGSVQGYPANLVTTQSPLPGTRLYDTGAPLIVLTLGRSGKESGVPEKKSTITATADKPVDLAAASVLPGAKVPAVKIPAVKAPATTTLAKPKPSVTAKKSVTTTKKVAAVPGKKLPQHRPPAFVVAGARREPLDEMPLTSRAALLLRWVQSHPKPTDANVKHWLYQHSWIVTGAEMGWWHGAAALDELVTVDQRVWKLWGIGERSEAIAQQALAQVKSKSS
jgi:PASTA domain